MTKPLTFACHDGFNVRTKNARLRAHTHQLCRPFVQGWRKYCLHLHKFCAPNGEAFHRISINEIVSHSAHVAQPVSDNQLVVRERALLPLARHCVTCDSSKVAEKRHLHIWIITHFSQWHLICSFHILRTFKTHDFHLIEAVLQEHLPCGLPIVNIRGLEMFFCLVGAMADRIGQRVGCNPF